MTIRSAFAKQVNPPAIARPVEDGDRVVRRELSAALDLADDVDLVRADLGHLDADRGVVLEVLGRALEDVRRDLVDRPAVRVDVADEVQRELAVGPDGDLLTELVVLPDVDLELIAGADAVADRVLRLPVVRGGAAARR